MTREYWLEKFSIVERMLDDYECNKLALTKRELNEAWDEFRYWKRKCPHGKTEHGYIDVYSHDTIGKGRTDYYIVTYCADCNTIIERKWVEQYQIDGSMKRLNKENV